jgi:uncharacterized protein (TIGR02646 family)
MVQIPKTNTIVPPILAAGGAGEIETLALKSAFDNNQLDFEFKTGIYGHTSVKTKLKTIQSKKCCFCESKVPHISHGDVEHFRPKGGVQIEGQASLIKPGYYWLAYDFSNLFYSCQICNQTHKKNFFPLQDETKRAKTHHDDYRLEEGLILHPTLDNPSEHLDFESEFIKPKNNSIKGQTTIKYAGLDREDLVEQRREYIETFKILAIIARSGNIEAKKHFKKVGKRSALFSLMIRCNFPDLV